MKENVIQINGGIAINVDVSVKNVMFVKKIIFGRNPAACSCGNGKYLPRIMDDSVITCDEIMVIQRKNKNSSNKFYLKKCSL